MLIKLNDSMRKFWRMDRSSWGKFLRGDRASMTQVMLISLMIPTTIALIVSTALTQLFVQYQDNRKTNMTSATQVASAYLLNDINTKLPSRYAAMTPAQLKAETAETISTVNATTYAKTFNVDANGWITATFAVNLTGSPGDPGTYSVQYRPTSATVFKGFDPTTKRPLWSFTSGSTDATKSLTPLGLYEQVPTVSSVGDYPTINRPGVKASAPLNLRILRSKQFGQVLAWDKPANAADSLLTGYRVDSTKNTACYNLAPETGTDVYADGYITLTKDYNSTDVSSWKCGSSDPTNRVSVRGIGIAGTGVAAFVDLKTVVTYDLDNLKPSVPANVTYAKTGASDVLSWDNQTCNFGYNIQFRVSKTRQANVTGNYGITADWSNYVASGGRYSFVIPATNVTAGGTNGWKVEARCLNNTFGASDSSGLSNEATTVSPITTTPNLANAKISGTTNFGTASWSAVTNCVAPAVAQYRVSYTLQNGVAADDVIKDWGVNYTSVGVTSKIGTKAAVEVDARCAAANGGSALYGPTATDTSDPWLAAVGAPTGTLSLTDNNVNVVTYKGMTCAAGSTIQYYVTQTVTNGSASATVLQNWGAAGTDTATTSQGGNQTVTAKARCAVGTVYSANSATATTSWTRPVSAPAWTKYPGLSGYRTFSWAASCSAGTVQYQFDVYIQGGAKHVTGGWNGTTQINDSNFGGVGWGSYGGTIQARCNVSGVVSPAIVGSSNG
jgi:hypothetical protein